MQTHLECHKTHTHTHGCGSKPIVPFGVGAPPILGPLRHIVCLGLEAIRCSILLRCWDFHILPTNGFSVSNH